MPIPTLDGVYAAGEEDGRPEFHRLPDPEDDDVLRLTQIVARRITSLMERRGLGSEADTGAADPLSKLIAKLPHSPGRWGVSLEWDSRYGCVDPTLRNANFPQENFFAKSESTHR